MSRCQSPRAHEPPPYHLNYGPTRHCDGLTQPEITEEWRARVSMIGVGTDTSASSPSPFPSSDRLVEGVRLNPVEEPKDYAERIARESGFDLTVCPGCDLTLPVEFTVRMLRFVDKHKVEHRNVRTCRPCAGFRGERVVLLALLHDRGLLEDDQYVDLLQKAMP